VQFFLNRHKAVKRRKLKNRQAIAKTCRKASFQNTDPTVWHDLAVVLYAADLLKTKSMKRDNPLRILVADDFAEWRVRVRTMLQARPEWEVIGEACDGVEAVQRTTELHPDIVLLDIGMPMLNGIEAARRIRQHSPSSRIIFVTQESDADIRTAALATGAEGYLLKANAMTELLPAVEAWSPRGYDARALSCD
jgi:CheY-like chemotaxis protein